MMIKDKKHCFEDKWYWKYTIFIYHHYCRVFFCDSNNVEEEILDQKSKKNSVEEIF